MTKNEMNIPTEEMITAIKAILFTDPSSFLYFVMATIPSMNGTKLRKP